LAQLLGHLGVFLTFRNCASLNGLRSAGARVSGIVCRMTIVTVVSAAQISWPADGPKPRATSEVSTPPPMPTTLTQSPVAA
jgi:hypothetical protein